MFAWRDTLNSRLVRNIGRTALIGRFAVDPMLSYTQPRAERAVPDNP